MGLLFQELNFMFSDLTDSVLIWYSPVYRLSISIFLLAKEYIMLTSNDEIIIRELSISISHNRNPIDRNVQDLFK